MQISYEVYQWLSVVWTFAITYGFYRLWKFLFFWEVDRQKNHVLIHGATLNKYQQWLYKLPREVKPL